jgi:hypothetical protein
MPIPRCTNKNSRAPTLNQRHLLFELFWEPDIVGIQHRDKVTAGMLKATIPGGAHAKIPVPRMGQCPDTLRISL